MKCPLCNNAMREGVVDYEHKRGGAATALTHKEWHEWVAREEKDKFYFSVIGINRVLLCTRCPYLERYNR